MEHEKLLGPNTKWITSDKDAQESDFKSEKDTANHLNCEIPLHTVKQKLETFQTNIVFEVHKKMENMIEDTIQEMFEYELNVSPFKNLTKEQNVHIWSNRIQTVKGSEDGRQATNGKRKLPEKVFLPRQSYLTGLLEVKHIRVVYHICLVIFSVVFMNLFIYDLIVEGNFNFGLGTIQTGFAKFHITIVLWSCMQAIVLGFYYGFKVWAKVRFFFKTNKSLQKLWNYFSLMALITFQISFGCILPILCVKIDLPVGDSSLILLEMIRLMMKMHAFVRTNAALQLSGKLKIDNDRNENNQVPVPELSKYLYFLFAPTLIYRDNYPRTKQIHWRFIIKNALEMVAVIFFIGFLYERYIFRSFGKFGKEEITVANLIITLFGMVGPGLLICLSGFYCILHITQNFVGELIKFADRMFYKDWWTATNFAAYFRDWNIIVHDWLYEYIYKDFYMYIFKGSRSASGTAVIIISAIIHEYLISFIFRLVYPVTFIMFGIVSLFILRIMGKTNSAIGNFILWWGLGVGNGIIISLYAMEYYARQNCPVGNSFQDYLVPVSWWCNGITSLK